MIESAHINWPELLVGRDSPPPGWWVGLAMERSVSTVELRASAVVALLAPPLALAYGRAPYLAEVPRLAREWVSVFSQTDVFECLGAAGLEQAQEALQIAEAAQAALVDPKAPNLSPELEHLVEVTADLVASLLSAKPKKPRADRPRRAAEANPIQRQQRQPHTQPPQPAKGLPSEGFSSTADALGLL